MRLPTVLLLTALFLACATGRAPEAAEPKPTEGALRLSPSLRAVLIDEMRAIADAMPRLKDAVGAGDMPEAARLGDAIADTFILRRTLTKQQHHELHHAVPREFLKADHRFHHRARKLADAARGGDRASVDTHVEALERACTTCHARFAPSAGTPTED